MTITPEGGRSVSNIGQIMAECGCQHSQCEALGYCMAARIIELEAEVTDMHEGLTTVYWSGYEDGKKAMEAKLAKAVEAEWERCAKVAETEGMHYAGLREGTILDRVAAAIRTTLAELTGGKNE